VNDRKGLVQTLSAIVGPEHVLHGRAPLLPYMTDANRLFSGTPLCAVLPANTAEVAATVQACRRAGVGFVPRGAGTGLSGGAAPGDGEVVISLARLRKILSVDLRARMAIVEPGVVNTHLSRHVAADGL